MDRDLCPIQKLECAKIKKRGDGIQIQIHWKLILFKVWEEYKNTCVPAHCVNLSILSNTNIKWRQNVKRGSGAQLVSSGRMNNDLQEEKLKGKRRGLKSQKIKTYNRIQAEGSYNMMTSWIQSWVELTGWWKWHLSEAFFVQAWARAPCFHPTCEAKWTVQPVPHNTNQ